MQSDLVDQILRNYLELPVHCTWSGSPTDVLRGALDDACLDFGGLATRWLNLEHVTLRAARVNIVVGAPLCFQVTSPQVEITIGQGEVDRWIKRTELPFELVLGDEHLAVHTRVAGLSLSEIETRLRVTNGWFVLEPKSAKVLGVPGYVPSFLRGYLPLPRLNKEVRIAAIDHAAGRITLTLEMDDFEEYVTPGLVVRMHKRVLPFGT